MHDWFLSTKKKIAIEIDELGYEDRMENKENKRQKELEEHLRCIFIRINPDEKDFMLMMGLVEHRGLLIS